MRKYFDFLGAIIAAVAGAGINPSASNKSGRKFFTSQRGTTKVYCESSRCKYRDCDLLELELLQLEFDLETFEFPN